MHGDGSYLRSWLHVEDSVQAVLTVMEKGEPTGIYNVHGDTELANIEVLRRLAVILGVAEKDAYVQIPNRVGQDIRYSMDDSRIRALGWKPQRDFDLELRKIAGEDDFRRFL